MDYVIRRCGVRTVLTLLPLIPLQDSTEKQGLESATQLSPGHRWFPKDLTIGQGNRISCGEDNVIQTIGVEPWVDFDRVRKIYTDMKMSFNQNHKTTGSDWFGSVFLRKRHVMNELINVRLQKTERLLSFLIPNSLWLSVGRFHIYILYFKKSCHDLLFRLLL